MTGALDHYATPDMKHNIILLYSHNV